MPRRRREPVSPAPTPTAPVLPQPWRDDRPAIVIANPYCPECGRRHKELTFTPFAAATHTATHWAECPTQGTRFEIWLSDADAYPPKGE